MPVMSLRGTHLRETEFAPPFHTHSIANPALCLQKVLIPQGTEQDLPATENSPVARKDVFFLNQE